MMKQENFSTMPQNYKKFLDVERRTIKAQKIISVLKDFSKRPLSELNCLDIGCSNGIITSHLAQYLNEVVGGGY